MTVDIGTANNAIDVVRHQLASRPGQDAVVRVHDVGTGKAEHLTYADLDDRARRIAVWLRLRVDPGARILLLYPPADFTAGFLGCLYAGMIAVPAPLPGHSLHQRRRVQTIAADADVSAVLTDAANLDAVTTFVEERMGRQAVLATDVGTVADPGAWRSPSIGRDDTALLQYTSGSTGAPKGVVVSHANLLLNAEALCRAFGIEGQTRFGGWAPQYHDMGLLAQTLPSLFSGGTCMLMSPATFLKRPYQWLQMIDQYDVDWSAAPNFGYDFAAARVTDEQIGTLDLSRWEFAVNGSEPVRVSTMHRFAKRFAATGFRTEALCACYGLAEATVFVSGTGHREPVIARVDIDELARHVFAVVPQESPGRDLPSSGTPARDHDVVVVDPQTCEVLPGGRIGEIWLRGGSVAGGYWRNESATRATFQARTVDGDGPYLRTGDLGIVADGELYITGRLKEMLVLRGRNLYPHDIEQEARTQHPELGNVGAAFAVEIPGGENAVVLAHEVRDGLTADGLAALATGVKRTVAREFGVPVGGVALLGKGAVHRTTSGKIERGRVRTSFEEGRLVPKYADLDVRLPAQQVWTESPEREGATE